MVVNQPYFGISQRGELSLWCENRGYDADGALHFWVINGHWHGRFKDDQVYIEFSRDYQPGQITWQGQVPFNDEDYNEAMEFIRELNWRPEMTKEAVTFDSTLAEQATAETNSNILNLANAYKRLDKRRDALAAELQEISTQMVAVQDMGRDSVAVKDTDKVNALLYQIGGGSASVEISLTSIHDGGHYRR